mmetsp:Transcript_4070/g.2744  ORF Transcript_4070/g.2744 Transcript_4070/m.2744 type:complete len:97 (-) Transcript_4070:133-423(-)|eukprot:CAMPEP_0116884428 /NCGR_PEP_ID=MMETSP0463-20121206/17328_1 /TAXON_ID=181622 /ORGANISM="Strombidinopsis sp, Strain SopsisLIS2011" /LENGTH=96 /DNA_ID=CAMNT_0004540939 /DNA_START=3863 /DNA_END=4153 /DNA_ORIENTATION=+
MIIMLNLLIAIISDTYARVASSAKETSYQEKAALIAEHFYMGYLPKEQVEKEKQECLLLAFENEKQDLVTSEIGTWEIIEEVRDTKKLTSKLYEDV